MTSAQKMASSAKSSGTEMYLGVTTSTSQMANKAIADWERIRSEYSKNITGTITITTVKKTINETINKTSQKASTQSIMDTHKSLTESITPINIDKYELFNGYYTQKTQESRQVISIQKNNNITKNLENKLDKLVSTLSNLKTINQSNNINITAQEPLSPSQVARRTRKELETLGRRL